jgi:hypothetical protein
VVEQPAAHISAGRPGTPLPVTPLPPATAYRGVAAARDPYGFGSR